MHGEFVVRDGAGGYTTVLTQTGTVTAISPTSITVRSEDGFSQTYVIPTTAGNAGAPPFAVDDQVVVRATRNGQTSTVTNIGKPQQYGPAGPTVDLGVATAAHETSAFISATRCRMPLGARSKPCTSGVGDGTSSNPIEWRRRIRRARFRPHR